LKLSFESISIKAILLCASLLISSCASVGDESADINECRKIAYGKQNNPSANSADAIYSKCKSKNDALRASANKRETTFIWIEFVLNLFVPNNSPNK
jgi:hypothetical protein